MDFLISKKETRYQPEGAVDIIVDNICDLYAVFADSPQFAGEDVYVNNKLASLAERKNLIMDVEILDDERKELLDRATFAMMKQRGQCPIEAQDGIQWAEALLGEMPTPIIINQVRAAVREEGADVQVTTSTIRSESGGENLVFKLNLVSTA